MRNRNLHVGLVFLFLALLAAPSRAAEDDVSRKRAAADQLLERAFASTEAGEYADTVRDAGEASRLYAAIGDSPKRTTALNEVGLAQLYAGEYTAARDTLQQALSLASTTSDFESVVEERMNLASVDFFTGRYADAAAHYDAVAGILQTYKGEDWTRRRRRILLANRATLDQRLGRYVEALSSYKLALQDTTDVRPDEHAQMLVNVGVLYRRMGDPYKALDAYDRARAIFTEHQHADGELGVLKNRGIVFALDLGRLEEARATFADALARATAMGNAREALQARLYGAETTLRLGDAAAALAEFRTAHESALKLGTSEDQWKALYGMGRCELRLGNDAAAAKQLRAAVAIIESIREAIGARTLRSGFFNDKREVFDALIALRARQGAAVQEIFELVERGHSRSWREHLGLTSHVDLRTVQRMLPPDALLLDYWTSPEGSVVVSVTSTTAEVRPIRVDTRAVGALADALPAAGSSWRASAAAVARQLLPPLPEDKPHILIVAGGALSALPFEVLPVGDGLMIERHDVTYLPTAALLLRRTLPVRRIAPPWTTLFRGFADPLFGSATLEDGPVRTLPDSAREVRAIARELGGRDVLHLGADNRKEHLQKRSDAPLLHIATHAFVDRGAVEQSRMLLSSERNGGPAQYLFLEEAYELPLDAVELAVLSACDTERGRVTKGEGIETFSRAFLAAGAKSTVTTFWRVPDAPTAAFMRVFYHHLQRGSSRAEALRRAKLRFLRSEGPLSDPHFWAAFVLTGDGLRPVPTAIRWRTIALLLLSLLAAAGLIIAWRWHRRRARQQEGAPRPLRR